MYHYPIRGNERYPSGCHARAEVSHDCETRVQNHSGSRFDHVQLGSLCKQVAQWSLWTALSCVSGRIFDGEWCGHGGGGAAALPLYLCHASTAAVVFIFVVAQHCSEWGERKEQRCCRE